MKKNTTLILFVATFLSFETIYAQNDNSITKAQETFCQQNNPADGYDAPIAIHDNYPTESTNYANSNTFFAFCIPGASGGRNTNRVLVKFDLSSIPTTATVQSATLELFGVGYYNSLLPGNFGNNASYIKRITSSWTENSVTWNTEPSVTNAGVSYLAPSTSSDQDYQIDVLSITEYMIQNPSLNFGYLFGMQVENPDNSAALLFHSSDASDPANRPRLCVEYRIDNLDIETYVFAEGSDDVMIYPNPAKQKVTIEFNSDEFNIENIELFDVLGQRKTVSISSKATNSVELDINDLSEGTYLIRYFNGIEYVSKRFVNLK